MDETSKLDTRILAIAAACHQQNRLYCQMLGDASQVPWAEAPQWQRDSAVAGVVAALKNPSPGASHQSWFDQKVAEGWVYGETKDPEAKRHPCMVPFADLPEVQQRKDILFVEMVQQLGHVLGLLPTTE